MRLSLQVHEVLQDLVRGRDDSGVRLETTLGDDEVRELSREVDVGHLERATRDHTQTALTGDALLRTTRVGALDVQRVSELLETGRVRNHEQRELAERLRTT